MRKPTADQFEITKWRCAILEAAGCDVIVGTRKDILGETAAIIIFKDGKRYKFSDPDWNIVNKQLGCLVNICAMS